MNIKMYMEDLRILIYHLTSIPKLTMENTLFRKQFLNKRERVVAQLTTMVHPGTFKINYGNWSQNILSVPTSS